MNAVDLDRIIFGCGNFGGIGSSPELLGRGESTEQARALLNSAREAGIYQFDTANTYGAGRSEEILGQWISEQAAPYRQKIRVSTKVGNPHGSLFGKAPLSRGEISFHLEKSLKRLNIPYIDVYYLHEPDPRTPLHETLAALQEAIVAKKIVHIGLSNVDLDYLQKFLSMASPKVRERICFVQNEFNFIQQQDQRLFSYLGAEGIAYVAFSPLAGGLLSGKYGLFRKAPAGSRLAIRPEPYRKYLSAPTFAKIAELKKRASKSSKTITAMALRFVLETNGVHAAVIGPRKREHFESLGFKF